MNRHRGRRRDLCVSALIGAGLLLIAGVSAADDARSVSLLSPSRGQIPNDTGSDGQTRMTLEKSGDLGQEALKVVFAPGDSFGDRVSRVKDWTPFVRLRFTVLNPTASPVKIVLNLNHRRTINYQTRTVLPITLPPGRAAIDVRLEALKNVNGSAPDLANVLNPNYSFISNERASKCVEGVTTSPVKRRKEATDEFTGCLSVCLGFLWKKAGRSRGFARSVDQ